MSLSRQAALRPLCRLGVAPSSLAGRHFTTSQLVAAKRRAPASRTQTQLDDDDGSRPSSEWNNRKRQPSFPRPALTQRPGQQDAARASNSKSLSYRPSRNRAERGAATHPIKMRPETLPGLIVRRLDEWVTSERLQQRLELFGFKGDEAEDALTLWHTKIKRELETWNKENESLIPKMAKLGWDAEALILAYESGTFGDAFESAFLRHFLTYASEHGPEHLRLHLASLLQVTDLSNVAQDYESARTISRKFHIHMGPTNSGKTYNALKKLSRAESGVYAGPLRLLAHEVWERINLGSVGDLDGKGRACNLITGEERRIVDLEAALVSCTVEMLPLDGNAGKPWDVVVIDEIQMMGDPQRGGAWTSAVMGVNAKEVHLCGDETTVALLQSMIDSYKGDTLTVHRYDRLTPLSVSDKSLDGKFNNVKPGDCVVTFSRSNVFSVKKAIEASLGKRCAVVYGALPAETRAEQAREFNEDSGRAEVLVASDAVGMGLNLKIGRIIFESLTKFNGKKEVPLSLSQVKQIAGRAGRFGQSRVDSTTDETAAAGGTVTTLHAADLPLLRAMLPLPLPPLTRAVLEPPTARVAALAPLLPATATYAELLESFIALAKLPPNSVSVDTFKFSALSDIVEPHRNLITLRETEVLCTAPVNVRDPTVAAIFDNMVRGYAEGYLVEIEEALGPSGLLKTLKTVEETLAALPPLPPTLGVWRPYLAPPITISAIPLLESLHKALVVYLWLSFRFELAFPDRDEALSIKTRTEKVLEVCLERLPGVRAKKRNERSKEMDAEHALYRRKYVDKHGLVKPSIDWVNREASDQTVRERKWRNLAQVVDQDEVRKH